MALSVSTSSAVPQPVVFAGARRAAITIDQVAKRLSVAVSAGKQPVAAVRDTLGLLRGREDVLAALKLTGALGGDFQTFLGGGEPTARLLRTLHEEGWRVGVALEALGQQNVPSARLLELLAGDRRRLGPKARLPLSTMARMALRDVGPTDAPVPRLGRVRIDFDKCLYEGDSFWDLVWHGVRTRLQQILGLKAPVRRLGQAVQMANLYKRHLLLPPVARAQIGVLLDGLPIGPVAREWAAGGARFRIKRGVLEYARHRAREIVRQRWEVEGRLPPQRPTQPKEASADDAIDLARYSAEIAAYGPALVEYEGAHSQYQADFEAAAAAQMDIYSSSLERAIRELTRAGYTGESPGENLLGIPEGNIHGSRAEYDDDGTFRLTEAFDYLFGERKLLRVRESDRQRRVQSDPETDVAVSDDYYYDDAHLQTARPQNRVLVDPDRHDVDYARAFGSTVVVDRWDEQVVAHYGTRQREADRPASVPGGVTYERRQRFFPDSRFTLTAGDYLRRMLFGVVDMAPVAAMELIAHRGADDLFHPAAAAIPMAAGLLYGPMGRTPLAHTVVGAMAAGSLAAMHSGEVRVFPTVVAGAGLAATHLLANRAWFQRSAERLGADGYGRPVARAIHYMERLAGTTAWTAVTRFLGVA